VLVWVDLAEFPAEGAADLRQVSGLCLSQDNRFKERLALQQIVTNTGRSRSHSWLACLGQATVGQTNRIAHAFSIAEHLSSKEQAEGFFV